MVTSNAVGKKSEGESLDQTRRKPLDKKNKKSKSNAKRNT